MGNGHDMEKTIKLIVFLVWMLLWSSLFLMVDKYINIYLVSESVKSNVKFCGFRIDT